MTFPKDLTRRLEQFALECDKDLLTLDTLYLALFAWYDIVTGHQLNPEECMDGGPNAADSVKIYQPTLAECLVYYPHWLRFTEVTGLAEFIHFFRYVDCAVSGDKIHNDMLVPDDPELNPNVIKALVLEIGTKVPTFSLF